MVIAVCFAATVPNPVHPFKAKFLMYSKFHILISYAIVLFGLVHIFFVTCLERFDTYALWFIGSAIAIVFAGFINLIRAKSSEKITYSICILTNLIMTFLFCFALLAMQDPQVYIGIFIFGLALFFSCKKRLNLT